MGGVGVGGRGRKGREGRWKNDDYHKYHGHDDRLRVLGCVFDLWADVWSPKHKSPDELTRLEDSAHPHGWFEKNKC